MNENEESLGRLKHFMAGAGRNFTALGPALAAIPDEVLAQAFAQTVADVRYHFPDAAESEILEGVVCNGNELPVFLHRTGRLMFLGGSAVASTRALHGLMRSLCACEIYFSTDIGPGLCVVHGLGTVIGSRHVIGKGFKVHQGCTVGHFKPGGPGCRIGDDVTLFANASIIGECNIGDRAVIGAHCLVTDDVAADAVCRAAAAAPTRRG